MSFFELGGFISDHLFGNNTGESAGGGEGGGSKRPEPEPGSDEEDDEESGSASSESAKRQKVRRQEKTLSSRYRQLLLADGGANTSDVTGKYVKFVKHTGKGALQNFELTGTGKAYDSVIGHFSALCKAYKDHEKAGFRTFVYDFAGEEVFASDWNMKIYFAVLQSRKRWTSNGRGYKGNDYAGVGVSTLDIHWAAIVLLADLERALQGYREAAQKASMVITPNVPQSIKDDNGVDCVMVVRSSDAYPNTTLSNAKAAVSKEIRSNLRELPKGFGEAMTHSQMMTYAQHMWGSMEHDVSVDLDELLMELVYLGTVLYAVQTGNRGDSVVKSSDAGLFTGTLERLDLSVYSLLPPTVTLWQVSGMVLPNGAKTQKYSITKGWLSHINPLLDVNLVLYMSKVMRFGMCGQTPNWRHLDLHSAWLFANIQNGESSFFIFHSILLPSPRRTRTG